MTTTTGIKNILIYFAHPPLPKKLFKADDQCVCQPIDIDYRKRKERHYQTWTNLIKGTGTYDLWNSQQGHYKDHFLLEGIPSLAYTFSYVLPLIGHNYFTQ